MSRVRYYLLTLFVLVGVALIFSMAFAGRMGYTYYIIPSPAAPTAVYNIWGRTNVEQFPSNTFSYETWSHHIGGPMIAPPGFNKLILRGRIWEAVPTEQNPNAKPCTIVRDNNANTCQGCFETDVLVVTRATSNKQSAAAKHKGNTTYIVNTAYNQPSPFYTSSAVGDYQYVNPEYWSKARGLTLLQYCTLPTN